MVKVERILCPTDLSTESDEALRYAVALALVYEAELFLLHCSKEHSVASRKNGGTIEAYSNRLFTAALAPHIGLAAPGVLKWEGVFRNDVRHIGKAILLEAATLGVDLIVMRSRRRPRAAALLGSTAETICRNAPCPVLVTHPHEREWVAKSTAEIDLNRVLIAHNFSQDSEMALNYGLSLAQEYQAEVHVMHVLATSGHEEPELAWSSVSGGNAYTFTARKLRETLPPEVFLWCNVVNVVRCGKVSEEILHHAKEHDVDLICMGTGGSDWTVEKLLGSNVDRVLRQAPCPVLVASSTGHPYSALRY